ncbi:tetratricopeptide repeat protein [Mucilaginibacter sp. RS28]|uniref:Tetratricopeptide repeat protein n=1 Tax=Mucilaginibacter straminoryzae TaxID=2932774 RepID=A0A9X1X7I5_9SPHI|nr:tetratricopeptide repeat protein [Mucilaginibacter straminoryzae]MCJ8211123.1 tetratricopeptide repeat protein [Mucilaginibacter straminoryzae]
MSVRKLLLSLIVVLLTAPLAFCQTEALKGVVNSLAYYRQQKDLKYLGNAKRQVDSLIRTKKDSNNLDKSIFRAVVYSSILYTDSLNKLGLPDNTLQTTSQLLDRIAERQQIYRYQVELGFSQRCLANVYIRKGSAALKAGKYEDALNAFQQAEHFAPRYRRINSYIAFTNNKLGRYQDAAKYYNTLLTTDTLYSEDVLAAANAYKNLRDTAKALQVIQKGRKLLPGDKALLFEEANIYNNKHDYKSLEPLLDQLLDKTTTDASLIFMAANCYDHLNKDDHAESLYLQAIELNGNYYDAIFNLALLYFKRYTKKNDDQQKNIDRAIQWFERAKSIKPNDPDCLQMLQWAYLKTRNEDQLNRINEKLKQINN